MFCLEIVSTKIKPTKMEKRNNEIGAKRDNDILATGLWVSKLLFHFTWMSHRSRLCGLSPIQSCIIWEVVTKIAFFILSVCLLRNIWTVLDVTREVV